MRDEALYEYYSGKTVLVTGHTGFKGSWLCYWLRRMGARVVGVALPAVPGSLHDKLTKSVPDLVAESYVCDIGTEPGRLTEILTEERPDVVFHLAAQPLVRQSYDDPVGTYRTNVMGTLNVLMAMRAAGVEHGVMVTTDKCYRNDASGKPFAEDDPFGGSDPYSSSKGCCEVLIASMRESYPELSKVCSARAGNVVGGGDYAQDRIVPDYVRALETGTELLLRNPRSTRPWQHVLEPLHGYLLLGMRDAPGCGVNFGPSPDVVHTVAEVVDALNNSKFMLPGSKGVATRVVGRDTTKPEAKVLSLDSTLAGRLLGWHPVFTLQETADSILRWYRVDKEGGTDVACEQDIDCYEGALG